MKKTKIAGSLAGMLGMAMVLGTVFWVFQGDGGGSKRPNQSKKRSNAASQTLGALNNSGSSASTGGLSVAPSSQADNLGQMTPNTEASGSSGNAKTVRTPFDPTTYGEYEKYKDGSSAMYADVVNGTGAELSANMKAAVFYKGWLTDGKLFDESQLNDKGELQPIVFTLGAGQVVPGWEQALAGMKVGGVRLVIVPPAVGYGAGGHGPVPPNAVMIFQVQLAAVQ